MYSMKPVDLGAYVSRVLGLWLLLFKILPNLNQNEISQNPTWPGCGWLIFVQRHRKPIELSNQVQLGPLFFTFSFENFKIKFNNSQFLALSCAFCYCGMNSSPSLKNNNYLIDFMIYSIIFNIQFFWSKIITF